MPEHGLSATAPGGSRIHRPVVTGFPAILPAAP